MPRIGDHRQPRLRHGGDDLVHGREEHRVLIAHDPERRDGQRAQRDELIGLGDDVVHHRRPHHGRLGVPLVVGVLAKPGPLGQHSLIRLRPEQIELVGQLLERSHATGANHLAGRRDQLGVGAGRRAGRRVHEHHRGGPPRLREQEATHGHATHRMAEDPQVVQVTGVDHARDVGRQAIQRVGAFVVGLVALAVPAVVEGDDAVSLRQHVEVMREVLLRTTDAVDEEQSRSRRIALRDRRQAHAVVGRHRHRVNLRPGERRVNKPVT
jgi:hypothetical protein